MSAHSKHRRVDGPRHCGFSLIRSTPELHNKSESVPRIYKDLPLVLSRQTRRSQQPPWMCLSLEWRIFSPSTACIIFHCGHTTTLQLWKPHICLSGHMGDNYWGIFLCPHLIKILITCRMFFLNSCKDLHSHPGQAHSMWAEEKQVCFSFIPSCFLIFNRMPVTYEFHWIIDLNQLFKMMTQWMTLLGRGALTTLVMPVSMG